MNREAIRRAADWLETHPDKHIASIYATDAAGVYVSPLDPRAACFCAMGRILFEMGPGAITHPTGLTPNRVIGRAAGLTQAQCQRIVRLNDFNTPGPNEMRHDDRPMGDPCVIAYLREVAA